MRNDNASLGKEVSVFVLFWLQQGFIIVCGFSLVAASGGYAIIVEHGL